MCLSYVHLQIIMFQHLYLKSSFWCALLLIEVSFMSTRSANTMARNSSSFLQTSLWSLSWHPNATEHIILVAVGCPSPLFCKVPHFCFHLFTSLFPATFHHRCLHCFLHYRWVHTLNILGCSPSKALGF